MTPYNSLNVKLSNSQLNKIKSAIKNEIEVVLRLPRNIIDDSNDEANFPHKLLLADRQTMIQSGGFLGKLLGSLLKNWIIINKKCN